ncbi:hypothetical protein GCM10027299_28920 [Larkinella ripae]
MEADKSPFLVVDPQKSLYKLVDGAPDTDYFFEIMKGDVHREGKVMFVVAKKPAGLKGATETGIEVLDDQLLSFFESWKENVITFHKMLYFDAPEKKIFESYQNEFFQNFEIIDKDADSEPFDLEKQIIIDRYLDGSIKKIEDKISDSEVSESDKAIYLALLEQCAELKETQTQSTKNETVKKLTGIWAWARQKGLKFLEVFKSEFVKELAKGAIKYMLGEAGDAADAL